MTREAWVVVDLGFGDSGKGSIVDFLVRDRGADFVVRFNGGAQAGHNVVTDDGRHHTFAQFGSGSFVPGVRTHLGPDFVLHPGGMWLEAQALVRVGLDDVLDRTTVDERALIVSPFQQSSGRLRELLRGRDAHGTCGIGIGETVGDAHDDHDDVIRAGDLSDPDTIVDRLTRQRRRKRDELVATRSLTDDRAVVEWQLLDDDDVIERIIASWSPLIGRLQIVDRDDARRRIAESRGIVCEGAQGVLLDQTWGFHPHTTWSDCTPRGARALLTGLFDVTFTLGVTRAYATRHGVGPLPTEDPHHTSAHTEPHNRDDGWQGRFRTGALDAVLLRYAIAVASGVDGIAITCLDQTSDPRSIAVAYEVDGEVADDMVVREPGGEVVALRGGKPDDLEHRSRLRQLLDHSVRPVITTLTDDEHVPRLEKELGVDIWLTSHGPTSVDKRWQRDDRKPSRRGD